MAKLKLYRNILYFLIFMLIIYFLYCNFHKEIYVFALKNFITPKSVQQNKYFIDNFSSIVSPFYNGDIPINNNSVNINRNAKNQYALNNKINTKDLDLINPSNDTLDILLKRLIPFINIDGKPVSFDDFIVVDVLSTNGSYFPSFHTDVEWRSFYNNNGFQIWILLEEDPDIKPRGNMFIMESHIVRPGLSLQIKDKQVNVLNNNSSNDQIIKSYNSLSEINPNIRYLNPRIGDVFIMNPSLFHCSDPYNVKSKRRAVNIRFIHKSSSKLKIGDLSNPYTKLIRTKHYCKNINDSCEFDFENNKNRYKFK